MNEPIDVLAIAARRLSEAQAKLSLTAYMQAGPAAAEAYQEALVEVAIASRDMVAAHLIARELAQ